MWLSGTFIAAIFAHRQADAIAFGIDIDNADFDNIPRFDDLVGILDKPMLIRIE